MVMCRHGSGGVFEGGKEVGRCRRRRSICEDTRWSSLGGGRQWPEICRRGKGATQSAGRTRGSHRRDKVACVRLLVVRERCERMGGRRDPGEVFVVVPTICDQDGLCNAYGRIFRVAIIRIRCRRVDNFVVVFSFTWGIDRVLATFERCFEQRPIVFVFFLVTIELRSGLEARVSIVLVFEFP